MPADNIIFFSKESGALRRIAKSPVLYPYLFLLLKISAVRSAKTIDVAIPAAVAESPPVNIPIAPFSSMAFFTPSESAYPNPVRGTLAPAPAKSAIYL